MRRRRPLLLIDLSATEMAVEMADRSVQVSADTRDVAAQGVTSVSVAATQTSPLSPEAYTQTTACGDQSVMPHTLVGIQPVGFSIATPRLPVVDVVHPPSSMSYDDDSDRSGHDDTMSDLRWEGPLPAVSGTRAARSDL